MDLGIKGRTALVCGASKGLGHGCAEALVREGVNVVIVARGTADLEVATRALSKVAADTGSGNFVRRVAADITTEEGRAAVFSLHTEFDIVVTNAGGPPPGDFRNWSRETWTLAIDANMLAPIELIRATVDGMAARRFGRIVNITSSSVKAPISFLGLSNGARSGLTGFVASIARSSIAAKGVTINNLLPGSFDTNRLQATFVSSAERGREDLDAVVNRHKQSIPARRLGTSAEFGAICAFLCSVQAGYLTGQNVLADGGAYPGTY